VAPSKSHPAPGPASYLSTVRGKLQRAAVHGVRAGGSLSAERLSAERVQTPDSAALHPLRGQEYERRDHTLSQQSNALPA